MDESPPGPRLGRRLLVLRVAALGAATTGCTAQAAGPVGATLARTDNDPRDAPGYGHGGYGGGYGNGYGYAPPRRSVTDNDPRDAEGRGRGYGYSPPPRRAVTDNDPRDAEGRGRGWR